MSYAASAFGALRSAAGGATCRASCRCSKCAPSACQTRPLVASAAHTNQRRGRPLCLQAAEPLHRVDDADPLPLEQHLAREKGAVQLTKCERGECRNGASGHGPMLGEASDNADDLALDLDVARVDRLHLPV